MISSHTIARTIKKYHFYGKTILHYLICSIKKRLFVRYREEHFSQSFFAIEDVEWHFDFRRLGYETVVYDFGSGNGSFARNYATENPTTLVIGCEITKKYWREAVKKSQAQGIVTTKFVHGDGVIFLRDLIADSSLAAIHINFPDPWHKKRHYKRRVFSKTFFSTCYRKLRPHGNIYFITDNKEIFNFAYSNAKNFFAKNGKILVKKTPIPPWYPKSKYYHKWRTMGRDMYFFQVSSSVEESK